MNSNMFIVLAICVVCFVAVPLFNSGISEIEVGVALVGENGYIFKIITTITGIVDTVKNIVNSGGAVSTWWNNFKTTVAGWFD